MGRRYVLSKRERKRVVEELASQYPGLALSKDSIIEIYEDEEIGTVLLIDRTPSFFQHGGKWLPHLKLLLKNTIPNLPTIVVDSGAVAPLLRGADVMAPGVREVRGEFHTGDPVVVVDEKYGKPLVVGLALVDSSAIASGSVKRGKVVENIHRVGDKLWSLQA